jgi:hypothetical protein
VSVVYLLGVGLVLALCWAPSRVATLAVARVLGGLALLPLAELAERRRLERRLESAPGQPAPVRTTAWFVTLELRTPTGRLAQQLGAGLVRGSWLTATEVEHETLRRWLARHGMPAAGRLCARAERRA